MENLFVPSRQPFYRVRSSRAIVLEVTVRAAVHASEDPAKVEAAVRHVFPDATFERTPDAIVATTDSLANLKSLIARQKTMDASRRSLLRSLLPEERRAVFRLNKQAAFKGRVSFTTDIHAPLGDLEVECRGPGLEDLFKEMAPMTIKGHPVSEERAEAEIARRRAMKRPPAEREIEGAIVTEEDDIDDLVGDPEEGP